MIHLLSIIKNYYKNSFPLIRDILFEQAQLKRDSKRAKDLGDRIKTQLEKTVNEESLQRIASSISSRVLKANEAVIKSQINTALGINLNLLDKKIPNVTENFIAQNVVLIKDLTDSTRQKLEKLIQNSIQTGERFESLAKKIQDQFDMSENRAKLIAKDQTNKLYSQANILRQKELGITHFFWETVGDERVRDEHRKRHGIRYSYDDPPDGELPGEPVGCRCGAKPDFQSIFSQK